MGVSGGGKVLKYLVFIFNFLFFLIGIALLGIGIYAKVGKTKYLDLTEEISDISKYVTAGNLLIAVGVIVVVVAFFGCCGAITENSCMVLIFFILLFIIFIMEIAACIYGYVKRGDIEDQMNADLKHAIMEKYLNSTSADSGIKKAIDEFQEEFECCGYKDYLDWQNSKYTNVTGELPASCCKDQYRKTKECPSSSPRDSKFYHLKGCSDEFVKWVKDNMYAIGSAAVAFAIIQVLGMVFSMLLYCSIKKSGDGTMA